MKKLEIKKGDWIINFKVPNSKPWYVVGKEYGFVCIRRGPKLGKFTALAGGQLRQFKRFCENCGEPV